MMGHYKKLEKRLGYRFRRKRSLKGALTHRSYRYEDDGTEEDNQRLEFLGDAALDLVAAAYLYELYPEAQEGEMTQLRSQVCSSRALSRVGSDIGLGDYLLLGKGERRSGGHERPSNLADALEAVIGAAYLDGGLKAVRKIFIKLLAPAISLVGPDADKDNLKGRLQEVAQARWRVTPRYRLVSEEGPPHAPRYTVEVCMHGHPYGKGTGRTKRVAEMEAAQRALSELAEADELPDPSS